MKAVAVPLTDAEMEERRLFAKELEIYGAEEQPWVSTHKQMWRAGARAIRDLLATIDADRVELARLRAELWKAQHPNIEINGGKTNG